MAGSALRSRVLSVSPTNRPPRIASTQPDAVPVSTANPQAALLFYWDPLGRQVRIEGLTEGASRGENERYFHSRPRASQIAALASQQSRPLASRETLDARVAALTAELEGRDVPLPDAWGGFRLRPDSYEFWQHREDRLHDRLRYSRDGDGWTVERLSP